jgi:hypothetical protein
MSHPLFAAHSISHTEIPPKFRCYVHTCESKCVSLYQTGLTDITYEALLIPLMLSTHVLRYELFYMPQFECMKLCDIMYIRDGCETVTILHY